MEQNRKKRAITQLGWTFAGSLLFAAGVNLIIMPMKLYNGGFMGVAQLIRTFVVSVLHCLLYTSPSPRDRTRSRMPSSA